MHGIEAQFMLRRCSMIKSKMVLSAQEDARGCFYLFFSVVGYRDIWKCAIDDDSGAIGISSFELQAERNDSTCT